MYQCVFPVTRTLPPFRIFLPSLFFFLKHLLFFRVTRVAANSNSFFAKSSFSMRHRVALLAQKVVRTAAGCLMEGDFVGSQLVKGSARLADGRKYVGEFSPATGAPLKGTRLEEDGDVYVGEYNSKWQRHGRGEAVLQDGTRYSGRFEDDDLVEGCVRLRQGRSEVFFEGTLRDETFVRGTLTTRDYVYTGEFDQNTPTGRGHLRFTDGTEQVGTFYRGELHGANCKLKLPNGNVYLGNFMNGKKSLRDNFGHHSPSMRVSLMKKGKLMETVDSRNSPSHRSLSLVGSGVLEISFAVAAWMRTAPLWTT